MTNGTDCPPEVLQAIPWYPEGLDGERRGAVEAHAAVCAECRRELELVGGGAGSELAASPDAERVWARVLALVAGEPSAGEGGVPRGALRRARRTALFPLASTGRPLALAASIALALFCGTLGGLVGSYLARSDATYTTAASPGEEALQAGPSLDVVFRRDATATEIEQALRRVDGALVGGPSPLGVFRMALRPGADAAFAAKELRSEAGGVATFAEPAVP